MRNGNQQTCVSTVATAFYRGQCGGNESFVNNQSLIQLPDVTTQSGTTATISSVGLAAPMFQMIWQASDIQTAASNLVLSTSVATEGASVNDSSATQAPAPASSGLSSGQSVGIGIGVGVAIILLIVALIFWIIRYRCRKLQRSPPEHLQEPSFTYAQDVEKPLSELEPSLQELASSLHSKRTELPAKLRLGELGTEGEIVELS